jgi:hypothetical protein
MHINNSSSCQIFNYALYAINVGWYQSCVSSLSSMKSRSVDAGLTTSWLHVLLARHGHLATENRSLPTIHDPHVGPADTTYAINDDQKANITCGDGVQAHHPRAGA